MPLTTDRNTLSRGTKLIAYPVKAATKLFAGSMVAIDTTGVLTKAAATATLKVVGVVQAQADNSLGLDGGIKAEVARGKAFLLKNSTAGDLIILADVNATCFAVDDETVAKTSATNTRPAAGIVRDVDASGVWVEF